jgi:hypothetical protein
VTGEDLEGFEGFSPVGERPTFGRWRTLERFRSEHVAAPAGQAP